MTAPAAEPFSIHKGDDVLQRCKCRERARVALRNHSIDRYSLKIVRRLVMSETRPASVSPGFVISI